MQKVTTSVIIVFVLVGFGVLFAGHKAKAYYTQDLVTNGGFEANPLGTGWVGDTGTIGAWTPVVWHSGSRGANISTTTFGSKAISQSASIPANASSAIFSAWYRFFSDEAGFTTDVLRIRVVNLNDITDVWYEAIFYPNVNESGPTWTQVTADLTAHRGQTAFIFLYFYEDGYPFSWAYLDDISLVIEKPDTTAPTSSLSASPNSPNGSNSFYTTIPVITLSASDDTGGSGVNKTFYNWDGGAYVEYAFPFAVPQGTHTLYYYSSDNAGNNEAAKTAVYKVDSNKPSVNASLSIGTPDGSNGWYKSAPTVTLAATDGESGVDVIRYRWDGGGNLLYTGALGASEGVHTLSFSVVDKAGNSSDEASIVLNVDATDLVLTLNDASYQQTVNKATATIKGTVTDNGSGIGSVTVNGAPAAVDSSGNFSAAVNLVQGNNLITVVATDNAGRSVSASRTVVYKKGQVLGDSVVRPIIKKVSPNSTAGVKIASANQKVKVIGINFKKGAKVKVGKLTIKTSKFRNSTFIEITIPLSKLKKGKHDVTITNPDGQSMTVKKGFTKST